jgi:hypothetical protein
MMKRIEKAVLLMAGLAVAFGLFTGLWAPAVVSGIVVALWPAQAKATILKAAGAELLTRYFLTEIQPKLFPENSWFMRSVNDDAFVNNNTVELPHSGANPNVEVDRALLPAPITKRTDVPTNYQMEELTTDPTLLGYSEALVIAYNKRASILDQHAKTINTRAADRCLYKWAGGATNYKASTGTARAAGNASLGSQTGNRKAFTENDIIDVRQRFMTDNVVNDSGPVNGLAIISPSQYTDLLKLDNFKRYDALGRTNIPDGVVARAYGFDFYIRQGVFAIASGGTLKSDGAAGATDDQDGALFYSPDMVRRAKGAVVPFVKENDPAYYGSIFSMLVRWGASPARNDNKGTYVLYESN